MALLDTDLLIDLLRGNPKTTDWFSEHMRFEESPAISLVTKLELLRGCRRAGERKTVTDWLKRFDVLHVSDEISRRAEALFVAYHPRQGLGILDAFIAATALHHEAIFFTGNAKHFRGIPGLKVKPYR